MTSVRGIAKDDYHLFPHTWQKGLDYEIVFKDGYICLASDQGQINLTGNGKDQVYEMFDWEDEQREDSGL